MARWMVVDFRQNTQAERIVKQNKWRWIMGVEEGQSSAQPALLFMPKRKESRQTSEPFKTVVVEIPRDSSVRSDTFLKSRSLTE
ncbi:hypothetical protein PGT21_016151 [Puccinia graminis f. sp. tritici]|uniref:Uncharacterized protein n=1 Tax=Puccinia graminis f. sp. tritici TaxID=56615 RepID=A0A5B0P496_PUCGR|nr:hypothetical protein PGTUg99_020264 [Puccinia graminis f. sp. tritici]KAA1099647.1 hypothetical protein PGT21_016151 [Puccinia graminis f. sp. tritici]